MKIKIYSVILLLCAIFASCSSDDSYTPTKPTTGKVVTVSVGIDKESVDMLGGEEKVKLMLYTNFSSVSNSFNNSSQFDEMHFFMDKLFVYDGSTKELLNKTNTSDKTLIIKGKQTDEDLADGYYSKSSLFQLSSETATINSIFSQSGIALFKYAMIVSMGGYEQGSGDVLLKNNTVAPKEYVESSSVANKNNTDNDWDKLTVKLIKNSLTKNVELTSYLPSRCSLHITDLEGNAFGNTDVKVYPIVKNSGKVSATAVFTGKTDDEGFVNLFASKNIYLDTESDNDLYSNMLVEVKRGELTQYMFLPLISLLKNSALDGNTSSYSQEWAVDLTTIDDITSVGYSFDDSSNLLFSESGVGAENTATFTSDAKHGNGALKFNGSQYFIINQSNKYSVGKDYSLSFWYKKSATGVEDSQVLCGICSYSGNTANDSWVPGGMYLAYDSELWFDIGWEGGMTYKSFPDDTEWHNVVLVADFDENNPNGTTDVKYYLDGSLVLHYSTAHIVVPNYASGAVTDLSKFFIKLGYVATNHDNNFNGVIDEVKVFNRALNSEKVNEVYNLYNN